MASAASDVGKIKHVYMPIHTKYMSSWVMKINSINGSTYTMHLTLQAMLDWIVASKKEADYRYYVKSPLTDFTIDAHAVKTSTTVVVKTPFTVSLKKLIPVVYTGGNPSEAPKEATTVEPTYNASNDNNGVATPSVANTEPTNSETYGKEVIKRCLLRASDEFYPLVT